MRISIAKIVFCSILFINFSCNNDNPLVIEENDMSNAMLSFKNNFPSEYVNLSIENKQVIKNGSNNLSAIFIPVIDKGIVIGRFFEHSDGEAYYYDLSDYKNQVVTYDVINPKSMQIIGMKLDLNSQSYKPDFSTSKGSFWCKASCTLGAMAIAASDGPVPVMDVLAVAYATACLIDCEVN
tara:strand:- start:2380 stop:2922 length:543 start_codon:yes stop_codon:yes gene_type:complete